MAELAGLLLAAGASTRLGQPKQLIQLQGEALVRRQARLLLDCCDEVVVVTGSGAEAVAAQLAGLPLRLQKNAAWPSGMGSSLACGVAALSGVDGVLVLLCDQWGVRHESLAALVAAWRSAPQQAVAAAWSGCEAAPPVIFPASVLPGLAVLGGEAGARSLLASGAIPTRTLAMPEAAFDLDSPEDLELFCQKGDQKGDGAN